MILKVLLPQRAKRANEAGAGASVSVTLESPANPTHEASARCGSEEWALPFPASDARGLVMLFPAWHRQWANMRRPERVSAHFLGHLPQSWARGGEEAGVTPGLSLNHPRPASWFGLPSPRLLF